MNSINAVIVEDEESNQEVLLSLLKKYCPEVNILAVADTYDNAIEAIQLYKPNVVFLDIQLDHNHTAFELLDQLEVLDFYIIFTTAYDEYAQKAINEADAVFYITKPVKISVLEKAVEKVRNKIENSGLPTTDMQTIQQIKSTVNPLNKLLLWVNNAYEMVDMDQIVRCQSLGNYVQLFTTDKKRYAVYEKISHYENILDSQYFLKVHRSHLINLNYVTRFERVGKGGTITLTDESSIPLAPTYKKLFIERFR